MSAAQTAPSWQARWLATVLAVVILLAQLVCVAHYHENAGASRTAQVSGQLSSDVACPMCSLAIHAPFYPAPPMALVLPAGVVANAFLIVAVSLHVLFLASPQGRAPPS